MFELLYDTTYPAAQYPLTSLLGTIAAFIIYFAEFVIIITALSLFFWTFLALVQGRSIKSRLKTCRPLLQILMRAIFFFALGSAIWILCRPVVAYQEDKLHENTMQKDEALNYAIDNGFQFEEDGVIVRLEDININNYNYIVDYNLQTVYIEKKLDEITWRVVGIIVILANILFWIKRSWDARKS